MSDYVFKDPENGDMLPASKAQKRLNELYEELERARKARLADAAQVLPAIRMGGQARQQPPDWRETLRALSEDIVDSTSPDKKQTKP